MLIKKKRLKENLTNGTITATDCFGPTSFRRAICFLTDISMLLVFRIFLNQTDLDML